MDIIYTDVLVIGAGLAGERAAVEAAQAGFDAICLSLVPARRSHSSAAQGGMQAALGNCAMGKGDCPDVHFEDTVKGSDWGCDQEVVRMFVDAAPIEMRRLAYWGVPWNRVVPGQSHLLQGRGSPRSKRTREGRPDHGPGLRGHCKMEDLLHLRRHGTRRALHHGQPLRPSWAWSSTTAPRRSP